MAKFSIFRDDDEEEDDEEFCVRSPKRRRTITASSNSDDHCQQPRSDDKDDITEGPTDSGEPVSVILSDPDVLDCSICFHPLTIPVFQVFLGLKF